MIHRLVFENLKHRPVRTLLSVVAIGVEVTLILTLVGVSRGVLSDMASRSRGTGADILIRPPESSGFTFSYTMPEKIVNVVRAQPHVAMATGTYVKYIDSFNSITGIHLDEFNAMSGGLKVLKGRLFQDPDDLVVDEVFAKQHHLKPGAPSISATMWRVSGIVEQGKLSRTFADIGRMQELYSARGLVSTVYVKLDDPANTRAVIEAFQKELPTYKIDSIEDFVSLFSTNSVPYIEAFTQVVIGVAVLIGFLVVCLSMYTAVLERTREIGILKALGASPGLHRRNPHAGNRAAGAGRNGCRDSDDLWDTRADGDVRRVHAAGNRARLVSASHRDRAGRFHRRSAVSRPARGAPGRD